MINPDSPDFPDSTFGNISVDSDGNGFLTYDYYAGLENLRLFGIRMHTENPISWQGVRVAYDGDYDHVVGYANTESVVDENQRDFAEDIVGSKIGLFMY